MSFTLLHGGVHVWRGGYLSWDSAEINYNFICQLGFFSSSFVLLMMRGVGAARGRRLLDVL